MVFFNDPLPCPDPAARAVRMAVGMHQRMRELTKTWRQSMHQLDFGVGIAQGYATLGMIGFEGRVDYAAIGPVTNLAARLCDAARGGQNPHQSARLYDGAGIGTRRTSGGTRVQRLPSTYACVQRGGVEGKR